MKISVRTATKDDIPTVYKFMRNLAASLNREAYLKVTLEGRCHMTYNSTRIFFPNGEVSNSYDKFSLDLYRNSGFDGNQSYFFALLAEDSDQINSAGLPVVVGVALNSYSYSWDGKTIYIRNFVVEESYRSMGIGKILYNGVLKHAKENGCNRVEFDVLSRNTRAQKFYENLGAINMTEKYGFLVYRVSKEEIEKAAKI